MGLYVDLKQIKMIKIKFSWRRYLALFQKPYNYWHLVSFRNLPLFNFFYKEAVGTLLFFFLLVVNPSQKWHLETPVPKDWCGPKCFICLLYNNNYMYCFDWHLYLSCGFCYSQLGLEHASMTCLVLKLLCLWCRLSLYNFFFYV